MMSLGPDFLSLLVCLIYDETIHLDIIKWPENNQAHITLALLLVGNTLYSLKVFDISTLILILYPSKNSPL